MPKTSALDHSATLPSETGISYQSDDFRRENCFEVSFLRLGNYVETLRNVNETSADWRLLKSLFPQNSFGSGGIRTHAIEMTGALNQRLRPLGHTTCYCREPLTK